MGELTLCVAYWNVSATSKKRKLAYKIGVDGAAFVGELFDEPLVMPQRGVYEAVRWLIVECMAPLGFCPCAPM